MSKSTPEPEKKEASSPQEKDSKSPPASVGHPALAQWAKALAPLAQIKDILKDDEEEKEEVTDEEALLMGKAQNLAKKVRIQTYVILGFLGLIILLYPILKPIYRYQAIRPGDKTLQELVALSLPNMTDQALLSWVATGITEILTIGFGDFDTRVLSQKGLFTPNGWESFIKALRERNMREDFKLRQLVLTTAPANMPVIVNKGEDIDGLYKWIVEMPIIMTYATNDNVTEKRKSIARLTIIRVSPKQNKNSVGIEKWELL